VAANDVWAVGLATRNEEPDQALIERWDGTAWAIIPSPQLTAAALNGVAENSSTDVWAVGEASGKTLTEHWDGRSWQVIASPSKGTVNRVPNVLTSVVALAPDDVWAVGFADTEIDVSKTLTLHWNGTSWSIVPSPSPGGLFGIRLSGVTAVNPNDLWTAGQYNPHGEIFNMIQNWNGTRWSVVPSARFTDGDSANAISAIAADDIWSVGSFFIDNGGEGGATQTATWHWDGSTWSIVPSPSPSDSFTLFYGVVGISSDDVWAVGTFQTPEGGVVLTSMIQHWDGATWTVFPSPEPMKSAELLGVAAVSSTELWSVGSQADYGRTLIEHFTCQ
jgi:hypothetical protein